MDAVEVAVELVFRGLSPLVINDVVDDGQRIVVSARTAPGPAAYSRCGARSIAVHSYHHRTVADVPIDGRLVKVRASPATQLPDPAVLQDVP